MTDRITVRMSVELLARLDAWIAEQAGYVSRQEAVRRCVLLALSQSDPPAAKSSRGQSADAVGEDSPSDNEVVFLD